jgi:acyl-CoA thioesterase-1
MRQNRRSRRLLLAALIAGVLGCVTAARAETLNIVALGASNTAGRGVGASTAWPAQLAGMLTAKGYQVNMTVNAVNGDTSSGILSRADAIPAGTQVVLYDTGASNDRNKGVSDAERSANIATIASRIRAHGATPIMVSYLAIGPDLRQSDGIHLTAAGHARIAAQLVPQVIAAIGNHH